MLTFLFVINSHFYFLNRFSRSLYNAIYVNESNEDDDGEEIDVYSSNDKVVIIDNDYLEIKSTEPEIRSTEAHFDDNVKVTISFLSKLPMGLRSFNRFYTVFFFAIFVYLS